MPLHLVVSTESEQGVHVVVDVLQVLTSDVEVPPTSTKRFSGLVGSGFLRDSLYRRVEVTAGMPLVLGSLALDTVTVGCVYAEHAGKKVGIRCAGHTY